MPREIYRTVENVSTVVLSEDEVTSILSGWLKVTYPDLADARVEVEYAGTYSDFIFKEATITATTKTTEKIL